jgi:hypothetical protein
MAYAVAKLASEIRGYLFGPLSEHSSLALARHLCWRHILL